MQTSEKLDQLIPALLKAQLELPKVMKKDAVGRFEYTSLDNLLIIVKPILQQHGLVIVQLPLGSETMIGVQTTLYHMSGQYISIHSIKANLLINKKKKLIQHLDYKKPNQ